MPNQFGWIMAAILLIAAIHTILKTKPPRSRIVLMTAACYVVAAVGFALATVISPR